MTNELAQYDQQPLARQQLQTVEQSRSVAEVQSAMVIAKQFPRHEVSALAAIRNECKRIELAELSQYSYPRGGKRVTGPSIRLAEVCAQKWGNLNFGITEVERRKGESVMLAYCVDLETNTRATREFVVPHSRYARGGVTELDDPRDIYELVANNAARRLRACILSVIPGHVISKAVEQCNQTLAGGGGEPLKDRALKIVEAFESFGVDASSLEKRLGHSMSAVSEVELVDLRGIYNSLKDGQSKRDDWFQGDDASKAKEQIEKIKGRVKAEKTE